MKKTIVTVIVLFLLSLVPAVTQTYEMSEDVYGLTIVAGFDSDEITFNPYSKNGLLISPDVAVWILQNFDYPYAKCGKRYVRMGICGTPYIIWVGRGIGMNGEEADNRLMTVGRELISRGISVNSVHEGLTAVHESILFNNPGWLELLLKNGGDTKVKINKPDSKANGLNAVEYFNLIKSRNGHDMSGVEVVLNKYQ